jgi:magnesium-protoporphyrin IX monomethyl ester (oxidative) cyclase
LHPEFNFHPIFTYFDNWCKDERRHSRFFALMMRSQPQYYAGRLNKLGIKFFTLAVYITMYLRDAESKIYAKLGIDWERFDRKVIDETDVAARGVWGIAIRTDSRFFLAALRKMAENNRRNKRGREATGFAKIGAVAMRYVRFADNVVQYAKLLLQPSDWVEPLPRSRWLETCCDPADVSGIALPGATPTSLPREAVAV